MQDQIGELLRGGIDLHTHSGPGLFARVVDDLQLARQARAAGMRAVLIKAHEADTTLRAALASRVVPGIHILGGVVLNHFVGGLNPWAVDLAAKTGARMVWMPTVAASHHVKFFQGKEFRVARTGPPLEPLREPISILDDAGKLRSEVHEIIRMLATADVALGTGHISPAEIDVLAGAAREAGLRKLVITHPDITITGMPLSQQVHLARRGAFIEKCYLTTTPKWGSVPAAALAASIREIGAGRCVLTTDCGQLGMPAPVEGLTSFVGALLDAGTPPQEITTMLVDNPTRLMGLD